jgi:hypothetical protein
MDPVYLFSTVSENRIVYRAKAQVGMQVVALAKSKRAKKKAKQKNLYHSPRYATMPLNRKEPQKNRKANSGYHAP